jgi:CRP-like cAMP-binding protein
MDLSTLDAAPRFSCEAGHVLIAEGRAVQGIYFLEDGELEIFKEGVLVAEIHDPGAVIGEMSWLLNSTPTATVQACTRCTLRHVANPAEFLRHHPAVALHIAVLLARRLDSLNRYLVEIKNQFRDRSDHLGMLDEVLSSLMNKHPRDIPRRNVGD